MFKPDLNKIRVPATTEWHQTLTHAEAPAGEKPTANIRYGFSICKYLCFHWKHYVWVPFHILSRFMSASWKIHKIRLIHLNRVRLSFQFTVYPKKYAHGFVVLCFVVVMQSFIMNSHEVFIHIHQGCFAGTGAIVRLPQCQWSKPDGYGKISQCITTTKHSKAKPVCIFLGIYCTPLRLVENKIEFRKMNIEAFFACFTLNTSYLMVMLVGIAHNWSAPQVGIGIIIFEFTFQHIILK